MRLPLLCLLSIAALALAVSACSGGDSEEGETNVAHIPTRWATGVASDLPSLIEATDVAFIGVVNGPPVQRDEPISGAAASRGGIPMSRFDVTVETALYGDIAAGQQVFVDQAGGFVEGGDGTTHLVLLEGDERMEPGRYLFFASKTAAGALTAAPFARLTVTGSTVNAPEIWSELGALKAVDGKRIDAATAEVARAR